MTRCVLVTGGTGTLGSKLVPLLRDAGCQVRVLSRRPHAQADGVEYVTGDLAADTAVGPAVAGAEIIVHCAGSPSRTADMAQTANLVRAATRSTPGHLVYISVVGADRIPVVSRADRAMFGYFAAKLASELTIAGSGLPWTTLRATQFYELLAVVGRAMARLPVMPVPAGFRFQPVDSGEVAARLAELALGQPAGLARDIAGPRIYDAGELLRSYLASSGKRRLLMPVRIPGTAAAAVRSGANLAPDQAAGQRTWEEFLAARALAQ